MDEKEQLINYSTKSQPYVERRTYCSCSLKNCVYLTGVFLVIDFLFEVLNLYFIAENPYFQIEYPIIFAIILAPFAVAVGVFYAWLWNDTTYSRANLPASLIAATISDFALTLWILIYICFIYKN